MVLAFARRKYWDEDYVRSLEDQVQALLALQQNDQNSQAWPEAPVNSMNQAETLPPDATEASQQNSPPCEATDIPGDVDRSSVAMEELSVMM